MTNKIKSTKHAFICCIASFAIASCSPKNESNLAEKTLLYCSEGSPESFNPQLVTSGTTIDAVSQQLYNRLVRIDPNSGKVTSELARKVIVSSDARRYRFYLRKGVEFHSTKYFTPSRELTSEDVAFTFERLMEESHPYRKVGGGLYPFFDGIGFAQLIEQIIIVDDLTIEFRLTEPQASFLANMATDFAVILSKEYAEQLLEENAPEQIDRKPIGTGPFVFSEYKRDHFIRYKKHEKYWNEGPYLEQVIYDITPNNSNRVAKLLTSECDVLGYPSSSDVAFLSKQPAIEFVESTSMNVSYWAFNTTQAPFNDPKVRLALAHAVDKQAIIDAVYFGHARKADTLLPPSNWAHTKNTAAPSYDLEKAKELLEEAGYGDGFKMNIWAMPVQRVYNPNALKMAEVLQQSLKQLNIEVDIITYDWGTFRKRLALGEHGSVLIGWLADNSDPDNFYRPLLSCAAAFSGSNRSAWCNDEFDRNILNALATAEENKRADYYHAAEKLINEQLPLIPIAYATRYKVHRKSIKNVESSPYGGIGFGETTKQSEN
jgi:cationic peptide transport system substrate-binding protein